MGHPDATAIFSGAGISIAAPASLPAGNRLRNDVLRVVFDGAAQFAARTRPGNPSLAADALDALSESTTLKLEVVVGRLVGTVGQEGLGSLLALTVDVPNEAHLLAALLLARGGSHCTLNLDIGIEVAYGLLTRRLHLPNYADSVYSAALEEWRALVPTDAPGLTVLSDESNFADWRPHRRPVLMKLHGSLDGTQTRLLSPVVVDTEQLRQLSTAKLGALGYLRATGRVVVTGYSGEDIDVYSPLLDVLEDTDSLWTSRDFGGRSRVEEDLRARGIPYVVGDPDGLATTVLRRLAGVGAAGPRWPEVPVEDSSYESRFERWGQRLRDDVTDADLAEAWAWLVADLGDYDTAVELLSAIPEPAARSRLRLAEALYQRNAGDDRQRAAALYRQHSRSPGHDDALRAHALLRLGDIARGEAVHASSSKAAVLRAVVSAVRVLFLTRRRRDLTEARADAFRALQQTLLRAVESVAGWSTRSWPALGYACRAVAALGRRSEQLTQNGNRASLVRQQRLQLLCLGVLLLGRRPDDKWRAELLRTADAYERGKDLAGLPTAPLRWRSTCGRQATTPPQRRRCGEPRTCTHAAGPARRPRHRGSGS